MSGRTCTKWFGIFLFIGGSLNFLIHWHVGVAIGGDAVGVEVRNGRYYLAYHGDLTEVSEAVYRYSELHSYSIWITHPLAALGMFLAWKSGAFDDSETSLVDKARAKRYAMFGAAIGTIGGTIIAVLLPLEKSGIWLTLEFVLSCSLLGFITVAGLAGTTPDCEDHSQGEGGNE